jgi:helix-turn-helix protein
MTEPPQDPADADESVEAESVSGADFATANLPQLSRMFANRIELQARSHEAWAVKRPDHLDLRPPYGYRDSVTGRKELAPDPALVLVGRYLRRARRYARKSQQRLADESGVTQSMVSRAERGLAAGMSLLRLVRMCVPLGRLFPLGDCPHDHECAWQPIRPPERQSTAVSRLVELILKTGGASD